MSAAPVETRPLTGAMRADRRPLSLDEYRASGGYEALRAAVTGAISPDEVIKTVTDSGLRGRGGAGYSTGGKWRHVPKGPDAPKPAYVACNADEMEPGSIKDRVIMERDPHLLLEGIALCAYAIEASVAYVFIRGEYHLPARHMQAAIDEATAAGVLGERVLGSDMALKVYVHLSGGRYLCGEAAAMLNAIEGRRAIPRARPPHMAAAGLWARPTIVNNVETLAAVPPIVRFGADWYRQIGLTAPGTKLYSVAGRVNTPGTWELPMGTSMREVIERYAGGMRDGYALRAVIPGGASTSFVLARDLDVAMDFDSMLPIGSRLGTGTMVVMDDSVCPVALLLNMQEFFAQESCGWCTPCWGGLQWVRDLLHAIEHGEGQPGDIEKLEELAWLINDPHTFCDHAPGASQPLSSGLTYFRDEFEAHIETGRCPYGPGGRRRPGEARAAAAGEGR